VLHTIGEPQTENYVRKYLLVSDRSNYEVELPSGIRKEHFDLEETYITTSVSDSNRLIKLGKNDSYNYSQEIRYEIAGEKIQRKRQITGREYIELIG
jgi:hypothetical protein